MVEEEKVPEAGLEKTEAKERISALIDEHPEGIRLKEMEDVTGLARIRIGNLSRVLLDEGRIRKVGLLYFPHRGQRCRKW